MVDSEVIARETATAHNGNKEVFEYRVGRDASEFPHLPYLVEMRYVRPDGSASEWETAYMGHKADRTDALRDFAERFSPSPNKTLEIFNNIVQAGFDAKDEKAKERHRKELEEQEKQAEERRAENARAEQINDEMSRVSFKKEKVKIVGTKKGSDTDRETLGEEEGYALGGLVITDNGRRDKYRRYGITHQQSGLAIGRGEFLSLKDAKIAVLRLNKIQDWNKPESEVKKDIPNGFSLWLNQLEANPYVDYPTDLKESLRKRATKSEEHFAQPHKEPWQMTKKEYRNFQMPPDALTRARKDTPDWGTRESDYGQFDFWHKQLIAEALSEGKPVPPEVLKDYPDLQPKKDTEPKNPNFMTHDERVASLGDYSGTEKEYVDRNLTGIGHQRRGNKALLQLAYRQAKRKEATSLQSIESSRSPLSQSSDERQSNTDTIDPDDPRTAVWSRDPGRLDVVGIDTPKTKHKRKSAKRKADRQPRTSRTIGGLR